MPDGPHGSFVDSTFQNHSNCGTQLFFILFFYSFIFLRGGGLKGQARRAKWDHSDEIGG